MNFYIASIGEFQKYLKDAEKEGLVFSKSTTYYGVMDGRTFVGFTGIVWYKNKAIFKNHYVLPEYRKQGYFKEIFAFSTQEVQKRGLFLIEATCTDKSLPYYLKMGAVITKQYKDFVKVKIKL